MDRITLLCEGDVPPVLLDVAVPVDVTLLEPPAEIQTSADGPLLAAKPDVALRYWLVDVTVTGEVIVGISAAINACRFSPRIDPAIVALPL